MKHVFISYKRDDRTFALHFEDKLIEAGFDTWIDRELRAGDNWREEIDNAIRNSFALVVLMTPKARESEYITYEWAFSMGLGIPVIPIMLTHTGLHPKIDLLHYLDFTDRAGEPWDALFDRLQQIKNGLTRQSIVLPRDASPAVKNAVAMLDSPDEDQIFKACKALQNIRNRDTNAANALREATRHANYVVRAFAVYTLGEIQDIESLPRLVQMLDEEDNSRLPKFFDSLRFGFREFILYQIGRIGGESVRYDLFERFEFENDERVRERLLGLLAEYSDGQIANLSLDLLSQDTYQTIQRNLIRLIVKGIDRSIDAYRIIHILPIIIDREDRRTLLGALPRANADQRILDKLMEFSPDADELFGEDRKRS